MNADQLLLIDLSALAHQIYHVSGSEPDPSYVSNQIVARVRALSTEHPHAAICCDCPPYARKDIDPSYKATRPESIAPLLHQMRVAEERLAADGYPVWKSPGAEADDIIATAVRRALEIEGVSILIASSDKDLTQLIGPSVTAKSLTTGNILDEAGVVAKFGVTPSQMLDYLCLVGDASDNVIGAKGIGAVTAADLLRRFGSLSAAFKGIFDTIQGDKASAIVARYATAGEPERKAIKKDLEKRTLVTPSVFLSLVEFHPRWPTVRALITLRTDVDIPFEQIAAERTVTPMTEAPSMDSANPDDSETAHYDAEKFSAAVSSVGAYASATIEAAYDAACAPHQQFRAANPDFSGSLDYIERAENDRELTPAEVTAELRAAMAQRKAAIDSGNASHMPSSTSSSGEDAIRKQFIGGAAGGGKSELSAGGAGVSRPSVYDAERTPASLVPYAAPVDFSQQLEPRSMTEARDLAQRMFDSREFLTKFGTPQSCLYVILSGREMGMSACASLRGFHKGQNGNPPMPMADTIAGYILRSGKAKFLRPVEFSDASATFETQRSDYDDPPVKLTYSVEDRRKSWGKKLQWTKEEQDKWDNSNWVKDPGSMCIAACKRRLARLVYPDVAGGFYGSDDME